MQRFFKSWVVVICVIFTLVNVVYHRVANNKHEDVIVGDGRGYYAYLPQIFIYHTLDYDKIDQIAVRENLEGKINGAYIKHTDAGRVNKYSIGTAIMQFPFFTLASMVSGISGTYVDGYNVIFQYAIIIAGIVYAFLGLYFLWLLLGEFNVNNRVRYLVVLLVYLGTNLYYYTAYAPVMSHVYSFFLITCWAYLVVRHFRTNKTSYLLGWLAVFMLLAVVRPFNIMVILFVPFLTDLSYIKTLLKQYKLLIIGIFLGSIPWAFQSIVWEFQTGQFLFWSYKGEGFQLLQPHFGGFWIGFRKGALVYCPLLILSVIWGIVKIRERKSWLFLAPLLIISYLASSWWIWYYGDSFGQRVLIDYYGILFLPAAWLIGNQPRKVWHVIIGGLICMNLLYIYQYVHGILHPNSMNKERYFTVFGKTSSDYAYIFSEQRQAYFGKPDVANTLTSEFRLNRSVPYWSYRNIALADTNYVEWMRPGFEFSNTFQISGDQLPVVNAAYLIKVDIDVLQPDFGATNNSKIVFHALRNQGPYEAPATINYDLLPLYNNRIRKVKGWEHLSYEYFEHVHLTKNDILKIYIWNPEEDTYVLDNFKVELVPLIQND